MKTNIKKLKSLSFVIILMFIFWGNMIFAQGCRNLPTGNWGLFHGNSKDGYVNFYEGNWKQYASGDGRPAFQGKVKDCSFNETTMEVSWYSDFKWGQVNYNRHYTGVFNPKTLSIEGILYQSWGNVAPSKLKWSATAPNGSKYNPPSNVVNPNNVNSANPDNVNSNPTSIGNNKTNSSGGYWRRTGKVEYETSGGRVPTQGVVEGKIDNAWSYKAEATESTYQLTGIVKVGNNVQTIVTRGSWFARPSVIIPGVVIPCGGRAEVVDLKILKGGPGGRCDVLCRLMTKKVIDGKASFRLAAELITGSEITAIGYSPVSSQGQNTKRSFGEKGKNYKEVKTIYLSYSIGNQPPSVASYQVYYEYEWVDGPMTPELEAIVREENTKVFISVDAGLAAGKNSTNEVVVEPPVIPNPPLVNIRGTWNLFSGGQMGTYDEKTIHYTGIIVFADSGSYLSFGSQELLKNLTFNNNHVEFQRPLSGVTQYYEGSVSVNKIEGTFNHNGIKFYWKAEKK
jgi:hypothetical protein